MNTKDYMKAIAANYHADVNKRSPKHIRIMTSNILHSRADELPKKTWEERVKIMSAVYLTFLPDFLGLQEVSYQQTEPFLRELEEVYATPDTPLGDFVNFPYHGVDYIQNHVPILYNKHKYEVLESRYHLFPTLGLHGYQWALYRSLENPSQKIIHMNLHTHSNSNMNMEGFVDANHELIHLRRHYPTTPIFVTGDYNACRSEKQFEALIANTGLETGMLLAEESDGVGCWCHPLNSVDYPNSHDAIDHVSAIPELCEVKLHRILLDEIIAKGSDHCPMFIDVALK